MIIRNNTNYISVLFSFIIIGSLFQFLIPVKYRLYYFVFLVTLSLIFHFIQKIQIAKIFKFKYFNSANALIFILDRYKLDIFEEFIIISTKGILICRSYMPIQKILKSVLGINTANEFIEKTDSSEITYELLNNTLELNWPNNRIQLNYPNGLELLIKGELELMKYKVIKKPDANIVLNESQPYRD